MSPGKVIAAAAAAALLSGSASGEVVNVYNWSDYIDESILDDFAAETGIEVVYDVYDSNEILETKLLAGGSGYDVVVPTGAFLSRQIDAGLFQPLDRDKLSNAGNLWDVIQARTEAYDPGGRHSVNYMWGTTGIGYNVGQILQRMPDAPLDSWAMIFDPEVVSQFADCGVHVLDAPTEVLPAALNYLGLDPNSHDSDDIRAAAELVAGIAPHVRKFHSSEYIDALGNGDICLAVGWSGDVFLARDAANEAGSGNEVAYVIPSEGALMFFDQMAIPADAPNPDNAHAFINYILRPEVIAKASNYVFYANGNQASQALLDRAVLEDPAIYPDEQTLDRLYVTTPYPAAVQRTVTRSWTRVKTGR